MNKFKSLLLLSSITFSIAFASMRVNQEIEPTAESTIVLDKTTETIKTDDQIRQKLEEIEELLNIILLKQLEEDKKLSNTEKTNIQIERNKKLSKILGYLKSAGNKTLSTTNYIINIADKILSKKTLIALSLVLAPAAYYLNELIPTIVKFMTKKGATGTTLLLDQFIDGAIEVAKENPVKVSKIIGLNAAVTAATVGTTITVSTIATVIAKKIIAPNVVNVVKTSSGLLYTMVTTTIGLISTNPIILMILVPMLA